MIKVERFEWKCGDEVVKSSPSDQSIILIPLVLERPIGYCPVG